jgi:hypothetical protein
LLGTMLSQSTLIIQVELLCLWCNRMLPDMRSESADAMKVSWVMLSFDFLGSSLWLQLIVDHGTIVYYTKCKVKLK